MLEKNLQDLGLNEKEAKVYLASLELGQSTVQQISQKAGINRATAYFIIEGLMTSGLMSSFHQGKKQFFIASDPDQLEDILTRQKAEIDKRIKGLEKILPELRSYNNKANNKPVVRYYEGKEGIKTMVDEIFKSAKDVVRMAYSVDAVDGLFTTEERERWRSDRVNKNIYTKSIYTYKNGYLKNVPNGETRKVPVGMFPITCDIAIFENIVRIASLSKRLVGVVIEDEEIAQSMKAVFDLAWEAAEKYEKELSE
jgi:sugar-specific transcriptional regulator TrmB